MSFLFELWSVIVSSAVSWLTSVDNDALSALSNLLTILVITIGLIDWSVRKIRHRANVKIQKSTKPLDIIESTQKSFKAVKILNNPMETSEKIGALIEDTTKMLGGKKMKKFFKWVWYNKEQLLSIAFNVIALALTNILMFTGCLDGFIAIYAGTTTATVIKIVAAVLGVLFTALTVRNICVKYGLSSLETIDKILAERVAEQERRLTPEQKKMYKSNIAVLNGALENAMTELKTAEAELAKITALYNADNSLVTDFVVKRQTYEKKITASQAVVTNIEGKIAAYKAALNGSNTQK